MKANSKWLPWAIAFLSLGLLIGYILGNTPSDVRAQGMNPAPDARRTPTVNKKINADQVDNVHAAKTPAANRLLALDGTGKFPESAMPDSVVRTTNGIVPGQVAFNNLVVVRTPNACEGSNDGELCVQAFLSVRGGAQINSSLFVSDTLTANSNLIANANVLQNRTGNGTVKAGYDGPCGHSIIGRYRTFSNIDVNLPPNISPSHGASAGTCTIDFGFEVDDRFIVATAVDPNARGVTITSISGNTASFERWDAAGAGQDGSIIVLVY